MPTLWCRPVVLQQFFFFFSAVALLACLSCAAVLLQCQAALSVSKHRVAVFAGLKREFPSQWVFTGSIPPSENESLFTADLKYLTELRWFWCAVVSYHHSWTSATSLICSQYCEACLLKYYFNRCTRNWTKKYCKKKEVKTWHPSWATLTFDTHLFIPKNILN